MSQKGAMSAHDIGDVSHYTAIILLGIYFCYLTFQLYTHHDLFSEGEGACRCAAWQAGHSGRGLILGREGEVAEGGRGTGRGGSDVLKLYAIKCKLKRMQTLW